MFKIIPTEAKTTIKLDPPELINGRAFPAKGSKPTITNILINASIASQKVSPPHKSSPNPSGALRVIIQPRHKNTIYKITSIPAPNTPVSSPTTAKTLSVCGNGSPFSLVCDLPIPTPSQPPRMKASNERRTCSEYCSGSLRPARKLFIRSGPVGNNPELRTTCQEKHKRTQ